MELPINRNKPQIMHVDLNSCFATCTQQAFPQLRGKPIAIAAYNSPAGCIVAPSIEAKRYGIKTGMRVRDAKLLYKDLIVRTPDPLLIRDVHIKFSKIARDYSPNVSLKSIDEVVIDFNKMEYLQLNLISIGNEIKLRLRQEVGEWLSCNVGIGTNRFLAKLAASLHKPDGLDLIDHQNLLKIYSSVSLIDLNGINKGYQARLNANSIFTPMDFLNAPMTQLKANVFKSIVGYHWYLRLRGFEVDDVEFKRKSYSQEYSLGKKTSDKKELSKLLMKLCEKTGRRIRKSNYSAKGIYLGFVYTDGTFWHRGRGVNTEMYTTQDIFTKTMWLFNQQPEKKEVGHISVGCFDLQASGSQSSLFDMENNERKVSDAVDKINDKYGEFVVTPALMMGMKGQIIERISFGAVKEIEDLYM